MDHNVVESFGQRKLCETIVADFWADLFSKSQRVKLKRIGYVDRVAARNEEIRTRTGLCLDRVPKPTVHSGSMFKFYAPFF